MYNRACPVFSPPTQINQTKNIAHSLTQNTIREKLNKLELKIKRRCVVGWSSCFYLFSRQTTHPGPRWRTIYRTCPATHRGGGLKLGSNISQLDPELGSEDTARTSPHCFCSKWVLCRNSCCSSKGSGVRVGCCWWTTKSSPASPPRPPPASQESLCSALFRFSLTHCRFLAPRYSLSLRLFP